LRIGSNRLQAQLARRVHGAQRDLPPIGNEYAFHHYVTWLQASAD
jgi:hypothetical protein